MIYYTVGSTQYIPNMIAVRGRKYEFLRSHIYLFFYIKNYHISCQQINCYLFALIVLTFCRPLYQ